MEAALPLRRTCVKANPAVDAQDTGEKNRKIRMADPNDIPMNSQYMDYAEHERTYDAFIRMTKWAACVVVGIVMLMAIFLT